MGKVGREMILRGGRWEGKGGEGDDCEGREMEKNAIGAGYREWGTPTPKKSWSTTQVK